MSESKGAGVAMICGVIFFFKESGPKTRKVSVAVVVISQTPFSDNSLDGKHQLTKDYSKKN